MNGIERDFEILNTPQLYHNQKSFTDAWGFRGLV